MSVRAPVGDVNINPFDEICIGKRFSFIRVEKDEYSQTYIDTF